jgi:hypothetical protein
VFLRPRATWSGTWLPSSAVTAAGGTWTLKVERLPASLLGSVDKDMDEIPGGRQPAERMSPMADRRWSMVDGQSCHGPRATNAFAIYVQVPARVCRSVSGNGGDLLQRLHVPHRPETCYVHGCRGCLQVEAKAELVCSSTVVVLVLVSWKEGKTARSRNTASCDAMACLIGDALCLAPPVGHSDWALDVIRAPRTRPAWLRSSD